MLLEHTLFQCCETFLIKLKRKNMNMSSYLHASRGVIASLWRLVSQNCGYGSKYIVATYDQSLFSMLVMDLMCHMDCIESLKKSPSKPKSMDASASDLDVDVDVDEDNPTPTPTTPSIDRYFNEQVIKYTDLLKDVIQHISAANDGVVSIAFDKKKCAICCRCHRPLLTAN